MLTTCEPAGIAARVAEALEDEEAAWAREALAEHVAAMAPADVDVYPATGERVWLEARLTREEATAVLEALVEAREGEDSR